MLSMCYAVAKNANDAERIWWEMPLCRLWAMLHCFMYQSGQSVVYSETISNVQKNFLKNENQLQGKLKAYERNLAEVEYLRR